MHRTFGHTYKMTRLIRRHRYFERTRIGKSYILARKPRDAPCDIQRIFARFQHARKPIHRRIGIGIAHRLMQRRNKVVVFLAGFVV